MHRLQVSLIYRDLISAGQHSCITLFDKLQAHHHEDLIHSLIVHAEWYSIAVQAGSQRLQSALDLHSLPDVPHYCKQELSLEAAMRAATYAHKLSYTTFAPATQLSQNLFRPPAPQEWDFRASVLHHLAGLLSDT